MIYLLLNVFVLVKIKSGKLISNNYAYVKDTFYQFLNDRISLYVESFIICDRSFRNRNIEAY